MASDRLLIPVSTGYFALSGLVQLLETVEMIKQTKLYAALTSSASCARSRQVNPRIPRRGTATANPFRPTAFDTVIPKNISLEEAHSNHSHVFAHAPTSAGARAYRALVKEVMAR